ncbi:MAG: hypothetical protein K6A44_03875 [bacterium]|nr:hypothetical protein [bacterium]
MYDNKFYGYVIKSAVKEKSNPDKGDSPDFQRVGLCGILNYLYSTNPNKRYYGCCTRK